MINEVLIKFSTNSKISKQYNPYFPFTFLYFFFMGDIVADYAK